MAGPESPLSTIALTERHTQERTVLMNPYTPPTGSFDPNAAPPLTPERRAEVDSELKRLNRMSFMLALPGFAFQGFSRSMEGGIALLVSLLGTALVISGLVFYAKLRGRHPAWSVLGLASCLGLLVLYFLPKRCLHCTTSHSYSAKQCSRCGAPLGA
jgi:hypothetical protein